MKTQNSRIEELEKKDAPKKEFIVIKEKLDALSLDNKKLYEYRNEETGEVELMTEDEAQARFQDGDLLIVSFSNNWKGNSKRITLDGD